MPKVELIKTKDGSHSLFVPELNETYHSAHGAIAESEHIFIEAGIKDYLAAKPQKKLDILEIGFGTGLNALLTAQYSLDHDTDIHFHSLEAFPLGKDVTDALNYSDMIGDTRLAPLFTAMHEKEWAKTVQIHERFSLHKEHVTLQEAVIQPESFDIVFFDAFAPSKQAEMWELDMLAKVKDGLRPGGTLVTYCARGQFKRDLKAIGMEVETLPGPPPKKEMVRATRK